MLHVICFLLGTVSKGSMGTRLDSVGLELDCMGTRLDVMATSLVPRLTPFSFSSLCPQ